MIDSYFILTGDNNSSEELSQDDVTMVGPDFTTNMEHFHAQFRLVSLNDSAIF